MNLSEVIQKAIEEGPFSIHELAEDAGVSYDSLYSWAKQRRTPRPDNLRQLADAFDQRAEGLRLIADDLRRAAESVTKT